MRYERSRKEQDHVAQQTHDDIEPEHSVIITVLRFFQVGNSITEPTLLERGGNEGKHADHGHHTVVMRKQFASQDDTEQQSQSLLDDVVHASPEQSARCLVFQCLHQLL